MRAFNDNDSKDNQAEHHHHHHHHHGADHVHTCGSACKCHPQEAEVEEDLEEIDDEEATNIVTMEDQDTGEEFKFEIIQDFDFEDNIYLALMTLEEPYEVIFVRVVEQEDGLETLMSLEEEEFDRVAEEFERIIELEDDLDLDEMDIELEDKDVE